MKKADRSSKFLSYDYTDVSYVLFASASKRFKFYATKMNFRLLDIKQELAAQGFKLGTDDFIIAGAVLNATKNPNRTLRNTKLLLKLGGKLVLYEMVEHVEGEQILFGLLQG